jgi:uncharacterized coiled-coil DUF342 family protein
MKVNRRILNQFLIMSLFAMLTASFGANLVTLAQVSKDRAQFLEEQQIGRLTLELEFKRDEVAKLAAENSKYAEIVKKLDEQIAGIKAEADLHRKAADDRKLALATSERIKKLYKDSLDDANKRISKLERQNSNLRKVAGLGAVVGAIIGFLLGG